MAVAVAHGSTARDSAAQWLVGSGEEVNADDAPVRGFARASGLRLDRHGQLRRSCADGAVWILGVTGPIGAYKTTMVTTLAAADPAIRAVTEPTGDHEMLHLFYTDPPKYAAAMQFYTLWRRLVIQKDVLRMKHRFVRHGDTAVVVVERPLPTDWQFMVANFRCGNVTQGDMDDYDQLLDDVMRDLPPLDGIVDIDISARESLARMKARKRGCETANDGDPAADAALLAYLETLEAATPEVIARVLWTGCAWSSINGANGIDPEAIMDALDYVVAAHANPVTPSHYTVVRALEEKHGVYRPVRLETRKDYAHIRRKMHGWMDRAMQLYLRALDRIGMTRAEVRRSYKAARAAELEKAKGDASAQAHYDV